MGMTHSTSGKQGFVLHHVPTEFKIPREHMIEILKTEEKYRFSQEARDDDFS